MNKQVLVVCAMLLLPIGAFAQFGQDRPIISGGGGGIVATNQPVAGQTLFSGGANIVYWDWATNAPATNIVLIGAIIKYAASNSTFIANGIIDQTNFSVAAINYLSNLTYQATLAAAFINDTIVSNGIMTYLGNRFLPTSAGSGTNETFSGTTSVGALTITNPVSGTGSWMLVLDGSNRVGTNAIPSGGGGGSGTVGTTNTTFYITVTGQITFQGTNGTILGVWTNGNLVLNTNILVGANLQALQLIASNLTSSLTVTPQGSNVLLSFVTTNSVGTAQTTTIKVGSTAFLLEDANTNGVDVFTYTEDGLFSLGTNSATRVTVNGNNSTIGMMYDGTTNNAWPVIDARAFGLSTNGDQTANIQAAITVATNLHQRVFIPAGHYLATNLIVKGIIFEGDTAGSDSGNGTEIDMGVGVGPIIYIPTNSIGTIIRNITFLGSGLVGTAITTATNDPNTDTTNIKIQDCTFGIGVGTGIYLNRANVITIDNCFFNNGYTGLWGTNHANAVDVIGGHFFNIIGARIDGLAGNCANWNFIGCRFEVCSNAVLATAVDDLNILGCYAEGNTNFSMLNGVRAISINDNYIDIATTNIVAVGVDSLTIEGNRFSSTAPSWDIDATSFKINVGPNSFNSPPSYKMNPITGAFLNGTNTFWYGTGGPVASTSQFGSMVLTNPGTTAITVPVGLASDGKTVVSNATFPTSLLSGALNGQSLTGRVEFIQWDAGAFMTNGSYNSNAITYVTPSAGSGGLQGSAPFYLLYPLTPNVAGTAVAATNQFFTQAYMPPSWNSNAVNFSVDVLLATNGPLTATTMVFSVSASWNGSALTAPVTVTNNVPLGTGLLTTNFVVGPIPTSGTIVPNESVVFQIQYWSVGNGKITNNAWVLGTRCTYTNSVVQNGAVTGW